MEYFLGVDGGGTKTKVVLLNSDRDIILQREFPASNLISTESGPVLTKITELAQEISKGFNLKGIGMGIAGVDSEQDRNRIYQWMRKNFPDLQLEVVNDGVASLIGALNKKPGILINAGTGSIAIGLTEGRRIIRSGGWDYLLGDEGSAYWVGIQLIRLAIKDYDRGLKDSRIIRIITDYFQVSSLEEIMAIIYNQVQKKDHIAGIALKAAELASAGDSRVGAIFNKAGKELGRLIYWVFSRGEFAVPVSLTYSGSVFKSFDLFRESLFGYLKQKELEYNWVEPRYTPEIGAGMLVMTKLDQYDSSNIS